MQKKPDDKSVAPPPVASHYDKARSGDPERRPTAPGAASEAQRTVSFLKTPPVRVAENSKPDKVAGGASTLRIALLSALFIAAAAFYYLVAWKVPPPTVISISAPSSEPIKPPEAPSGTGQSIVPEDQTDDAVKIALKAVFEARDDDAKAIEILRAALRNSLGSAVLQEALVWRLNKSAVALSGAGKHGLARDLLMEATALSDEGVIRRNLANVQMRLDDYQGAAKTLETLPEDADSRVVLTNIYRKLGHDSYRKGDVKLSETYLEKAARLDGSNSKLRSELAQVNREAAVESGMSRADASHFNVKYEGGENAVAGHLIGLLLEEAYHKVGADLSFYPDDRIEALLYTREQFRDVTGSPAWAGALFDGRIKVPAGGVTEKTELLEQVLFHEYTHALVRRLGGGRVPTWLHEGLAQHEENKDISRYANTLRLYAASVKDESLPLRSLEGSFMGFDAQTAHTAYVLSLSATDYVIREFGISATRRILENLKSGMTLDAAINGAVGLSYDDLQRSWIVSLRR